VGFPGETERDFDQLHGFVETMQFDHLGVFTYSHEEGTAAHALTDEVPGSLKRARQAQLMRAQKRIVGRRQAARVGDRVRLLVDGPSAEHELVLRARLESQAPEIDSVVYLTDCDPALVTTGTFIDAEVVGCREYDLIARPIDGASRDCQTTTVTQSAQDCP
jgi:ribosomal protein S12 methylthiotransferase